MLGLSCNIYTINKIHMHDHVNMKGDVYIYIYIYLASLINYWIPLKSFTLPTYKLRLINMILFSCTLSIAMKSEVKDMKTSQKGLNNLLYVMLHLCVNDTILCFLYMISVFCSCIFNLLISKFFYV